VSPRNYHNGQAQNLQRLFNHLFDGEARHRAAIELEIPLEEVYSRQQEIQDYLFAALCAELEARFSDVTFETLVEALRKAEDNHESALKRKMLTEKSYRRAQEAISALLTYLTEWYECKNLRERY